MNATENQTVVASFISFLRKQNISEEHSEGIESKEGLNYIVFLIIHFLVLFSRYSMFK